MGEVCRTNGTTGYHKVYIDKTRGHNQANYEEKMINLMHTVEEYNAECRILFAEFLCATNFPSCDLTQTTPTPYRVSSSCMHGDIILFYKFSVK